MPAGVHCALCTAVRPAAQCLQCLQCLHYVQCLQCPQCPFYASSLLVPLRPPSLNQRKLLPTTGIPAVTPCRTLQPWSHAFHRGSARPLGCEWKRGGRSPRSPPSLFVLASRSCAQRDSAPAARAKADIRGSTLTSVCDSLPPRVVGRSCFSAVNPEPSLVRR